MIDRGFTLGTWRRQRGVRCVLPKVTGSHPWKIFFIENKSRFPTAHRKLTFLFYNDNFAEFLLTKSKVFYFSNSIFGFSTASPFGGEIFSLQV